MAIVTGLSGNEIYCLALKGYSPGELVIGNSVFSLGFVGGLSSSLSTLAGGEVTEITGIIHEGRQQAEARLIAEATKHGGAGVTGVSSELVQHAGNVEFLSIGSCVHSGGTRSAAPAFSTSADAQELYCLMDAGFTPVKFVFGNVAYSVGLGGGLMGAFRSMGRGEVTEFSEVFNNTRHLALQRITHEAKTAGANAVLGIETSIVPFRGVAEMVMIGTATRHPAIDSLGLPVPVTSDLTCEETWNVIKSGFVPVRMLLGVSVYSLGVVGGILSAFKGLVRGEISELTHLIYEARENAIGRLRRDAAACGADDVLGVKTHVYQLGGGIIELLCLGTAVKRVQGLATATDWLPPQAIMADKDTFVNTAELVMGTDLNAAKR